MQNAIVWSFETARFRVQLEIEPEFSDPADSFELPEDNEYARSGELAAWFSATVSVYLDDTPVGRDSLGACSYDSLEEFYTAHRDPDAMNRNSSLMRAARGANVCIGHYFPDMVRQAIREARQHLTNLPSLRKVVNG